MSQKYNVKFETLAGNKWYAYTLEEESISKIKGIVEDVKNKELSKYELHILVELLEG